MAEYIDREAARKCFCDYCSSAICDRSDGCSAMRAFDAIPATDVVERNRWIPVTERLPKEGKDILAFYDDGVESRIIPANFGCGVWYDCTFNYIAKDEHITHWMPLPEPPKEET